jgi:hypothetical protein
MSEQERVDELMEYLFHSSPDESVTYRNREDPIDAGWAKAEVLRRLVLSHLREKEEFLEVPAFEDVLTEEGVVKRPNMALKRLLSEYSAIVAEAQAWEKSSQLYGLMAERSRLAEAWKAFAWRRQKVGKISPDTDPMEADRIKRLKEAKKRLKSLQKADPTAGCASGFKVKKPRLTKAELKLLHPVDEAPDEWDIAAHRTHCSESWVTYTLEEKQYYDLNARVISAMRPTSLVLQEALDSQNDLGDRDDMDMVLPDYPMHHTDRRAVTWARDEFRDMTERYPFWDYRSDYVGGFCTWIQRHGGLKRLQDMVDNIKYYHVHAPRLEADPVVIIKGIKSLERLPWETRIHRPVYVPGEGWGYESDRGFTKLHTDFIVKRAKSLLKRWLCEEETLRPRLNLRNSGLVMPIGWDTEIPTFKRLCAGKRSLRQSRCDHCSKRVTEKGDWYWNLVNSVRNMFATQYRETGDFGVYSLFVKDTTDCRYTQEKLLGKAAFEMDDTWKIRGTSGDWRCLLCGRSKIFRSYIVLMQWTTGATFTKDRSWCDGKVTHHLDLNEGRTWVVKLRLGGEQFLDALKRVVG